MNALTPPESQDDRDYYAFQAADRRLAAQLKDHTVQTQTFDHFDGVRLQLSDAADAEREARMRRRTVIMDQDGFDVISVGPAPQQLVDSEQITLGCSWTAWDFISYLAPWATLGFIVGAVIVALVFRNA